MKLLIVEDEVPLLKSISFGLKKSGFEPLEAKSGEEAWNLFKKYEDELDLLLIDYRLPDIDGIDLLKRIRQKDSHISVIMMTAYGNKEIVLEAMRLNCHGFIEKPFSLIELLTEIERIRYLKEKNSSLNQKMAKLFHRYNNYLLSITGNLELAKLQIDNREKLIKRLENLSSSVSGMLDFNRSIMKMKYENNKTGEFDIIELLKDVINTFKDLLSYKDIHLETAFGFEKINVGGNPEELKEAFKNIIMNAIEAMENSRERRLRILTIQGLSYLSIYISDTGCGIEEDDMDKLFLPYFTTKKKGTGLGLPSAKEIIERHNGIIKLKAKKGEGTTFKIILPIN